MANDYQEVIRDSIIDNEDFIRAVFSGQKREQGSAWEKVIVRPVMLRGQRHMQFSYFDAKKDTTKNYRGDEVAEELDQVLAVVFPNVHVQMAQDAIDITVTGKGKLRIHHTPADGERREVNLAHDRQKHGVLAANDAAPFLKAVGIMTQEGRIRAEMQGKFRQINEFLRLVQQTGALETFTTSPLSVVDCGCGSAYLTFAFYYYLNSVLKMPARLTGIDVNGELLAKQAEKSASLHWPDLTFQATSIVDFTPETPPDIVLALHACDTATDEALAQGIRWQSKLIISAPCCQHHLQEQLDHQPVPTPFEAVERHNILKERLGDILTDTFRALILRILGYQTDVVEFVSSEHTAKNLMIRAVKTMKAGDSRFVREYNDLKSFWHVTPYLEQLLGNHFTSKIGN